MGLPPAWRKGSEPRPRWLSGQVRRGTTPDVAFTLGKGDRIEGVWSERDPRCCQGRSRASLAARPLQRPVQGPRAPAATARGRHPAVRRCHRGLRNRTWRGCPDSGERPALVRGRMRARGTDCHCRSWRDRCHRCWCVGAVARASSAALLPSEFRASGARRAAREDGATGTAAHGTRPRTPRRCRLLGNEGSPDRRRACLALAPL
jgi:hypothetical protein